MMFGTRSTFPTRLGPTYAVCCEFYIRDKGPQVPRLKIEEDKYIPVAPNFIWLPENVESYIVDFRTSLKIFEKKAK